MVKMGSSEESTPRLAAEMGWALSLAEEILAEHAPSDEF